MWFDRLQERERKNKKSILERKIKEKKAKTSFLTYNVFKLKEKKEILCQWIFYRASPHRNLFFISIYFLSIQTLHFKKKKKLNFLSKFMIQTKPYKKNHGRRTYFAKLTLSFCSPDTMLPSSA